MSIIIRPIEEANIPVLWKLEENMWTNENAPNADQQLNYDAYEKAQKNRGILVAAEAENLLGFISYHTPTTMTSHSHQWEIGIGVANDAKGKGVGRRLIEALIEKAREENILKISLRVLGSNESARGFYEHLGFTQEGHLKNEFLINGKLIDDYHYAYYL